MDYCDSLQRPFRDYNLIKFVIFNSINGDGDGFDVFNGNSNCEN